MGALVYLMLLVTIPAAVAAGNCPEIRLDAPGGSMEHVPVTSQGHVGICYAHSASQMLDAFRFSHPAPVGDNDYAHISAPLDLAAGFTKEDDAKSDFDDGAYHICPAAKYGIKNGTCDEERVRQLYWKGERKDYTHGLWKTHRAFQEYLIAHSNIHDWEQLKRGFKTAACTEIHSLQLIASLSGQGLLPGPDVLMAALKNENYTDAMVELLKPVCDTPPRHAIHPSVHCESMPLGLPDKLSAIHELLAKKGAQPIALKTCSNLMEEGRNYRGVTPDNGFTQDCKKHFLLVIGQKMIGGKCRYLMRNSWGTDEDGYSPDWNPPDHGNIWIDEDAMAANTTEACSLTTESAVQ